MPTIAEPYPRLVAPRLREALADTPAVLIHGPRQAGKTTLARLVGEPTGYRYLSFDDEAVLAAARRDPVGFVDGLPARAILDEVQRVPEIFTSLKAAIDARRSAGRFILTGSANVLLVPRLAESLAGRMGLLRLHPLSRSANWSGTPPRFIDALFAGRFKTRVFERLGSGLAARVVAGGYPAALARRAAARRAAWYRDYVETQVQRDVRDLSRIHSLDALPRLLAVAAGHTAQPDQRSRPRLALPADAADDPRLRHAAGARVPARATARLAHQPAEPAGQASQAAHGRHRASPARCSASTRKRSQADRTLLGPLLETFVFQELRRQASGRAAAAGVLPLPRPR